MRNFLKRTFSFNFTTVRVYYPYRILVDYFFVKQWISEGKRYEIFTRLMKTKATSSIHKKSHNLMLDEDFDKIVTDKKLNSNILGAMVKRTEIDSSLKEIKDPITKTILFSIRLSSIAPYGVYIFTNEETKERYENNRHYIGIKSVVAIPFQKALRIVDSFHNLLIGERDLFR